MARDVIKGTILKDGTIKSETDPISDANHTSATDFFRFLKDKTGGPMTETARHGDHVHHHHDHEVEHEHE